MVEDVDARDVAAGRAARKIARRAEKEAAAVRRAEREAALANAPPPERPTYSTDVRDEADAELFALLLRHPGVTDALHDLTRGALVDLTVGVAQRAINVCQRVGQWRHERPAPLDCRGLHASRWRPDLVCFDCWRCGVILDERRRNASMSNEARSP